PPTSISYLLLLYAPSPPPPLHSFPTRRSSDLINTARYGQTRGIMRSLFLLPTVQRELDTILSLDPKNTRAQSLAGNVYMTLPRIDRKSTRLNSSHVSISYAVFCLKKKKKKQLS